MAKDRFELNLSGMVEVEDNSAEAVKQVLEDIAADARRLVPKDTMELHDSIEVVHQPGSLTGTVVVGTDHWAPTEYGSEPHIIESTGDHSLSNGTGEFYGRIVHHPGTPEQPFMRPALYKKRKLKGSD